MGHMHVGRLWWEWYQRRRKGKSRCQMKGRGSVGVVGDPDDERRTVEPMCRKGVKTKINYNSG